MKITVLLFCLFSVVVIGQNESITVADLNFKMPIATETNLLYGFDEGDKIIFEYQEEKGKKLSQIDVYEYPNNLKFTEFKTSNLKKEITVNKKGIYLFKFHNLSLGRRICKVLIKRLPKENEENNRFNSTVYKRVIADTTYTSRRESYIIEESFKTLKIANKQQFYLNSGLHSSFQGGKSRVTLPIMLPQNTVKWYYSISSSRKEKDIEMVSNTVDLASDLTSLIDKTGLLNFTIGMLTQPPGANFCDVYLLKHSNLDSFLAKQQYNYIPAGSRENIVSAIVEIESFNNTEPLYLGLKNPDNSHGIYVLLDVVAIVKEQKIGNREINEPHINYREEIYLQN